MESLRYICWMFCLAQITFVSGEPEFGTTLQFLVTPTVSKLSMELSDLFASIDDELHFMLSGLIPNSENQRSLVATFTEDLSVKMKDVSKQLLVAVNSTTNVDMTLNAVLDKYTELSSYYNTNANTFISRASSLLGLYVSSEFWNALDFLVKGLPDLKTTVDMLRLALLNGATVDDISPALLRSFVNALRSVKARLPLMVYVFQRVGLNMQAADRYMVSFDQVQRTLPGGLLQDTAAFNSQLSSLEASVEEAFNEVEEKFKQTATQLGSDLTGYAEQQTNFAQIKAALQAFAVGRSLFLKDLKASIKLASAGNRATITNYVSQTYYAEGPNTIGTPALLLARQLIESSAKSEFCHSKFAALAADLLPLGRIRLNECFDTESPRLFKLREVFDAYALLVSYDAEDLAQNVKPCRSEYAAKNCLSKVAATYTTLNAARDTAKMTRAGNFFTSALAASMNRISLCFSRVNIYTFLNLVPTYIRDARSCVGAN